MRGRRRVLQLPPYTQRKWLKGASAWAYYFSPPTWARKPAPDDQRGPCPVEAEDLGTELGAARARVEDVLLPQFDAWRTHGASELLPAAARRGTLNWLFAEYKGTAKFKKLSKGQRTLHEQGFTLVSKYVLKDGRSLGEVKVGSIDTGAVDRLYEKLLPLRDANGEPIRLLDEHGVPVLTKDGEPVFCERRTSVNHAMKSCRRAWNIVARLHRKEMPELNVNPFAKMDLEASGGVVPAAIYIELQAAVAAADGLGLKSLAAALMVTWEWLQREDHIFTAFKLDHYRPKDHPDEVYVVHPKNGGAVWIPLFDKRGAKPVPLFPELMERMDALKTNRIGSSHFFVRDWVDARAARPKPWATESGNLRHLSRKTREIFAAAALRPELTFTSMRHGGLTELGDAELTDAQIRALSRHKSAKVLPGYVKRTQQQIVDGTHRRRAVRPAAAPAADQGRQLTFDRLLMGSGDA